MKRIIATILVTLMLMSTAYATATFEYNGGEIGDLNIDTSIQGKVTSYLYNGNTYSFAVNDKDFEKLNKLFSDQNLTNSQKSFNEPMTGNSPDYPKGGKYTIKELYDNENKYSITLEFAFDSKGVLLSEILLTISSAHECWTKQKTSNKETTCFIFIFSPLDLICKAGFFKEASTVA